MFRLSLLQVLLNLFLVNAFNEESYSRNADYLDIVRSYLAIIKDYEKLAPTDLHMAVWFRDLKSKESSPLISIADDILIELNNGSRLIAVDYKNPIKFKAIVHYRLVLVDSFASMKNVYSFMNRTENLAYTLIYFSTINSANDDVIMKAFHLCWQLDIFNVGIIVPEKRNSSTEIVMLTYYPFTPNSCNVIKPVISNRFDRKRQIWQSRDYFPEKIPHFHGCTLKTSVWPNMPFLRIIRNRTGHIIDFEGIEASLMRYFARALNFTIELDILTDQERAVISKNTGEGFKKLFDKNISYIFGAFRYNNSAQFSKTNYYFVQTIHLVVNNVNSHEWYYMLLRPLQPQVWLLIGLSFAFGFAVVFAAGYCNIPTCSLPFIIGHTKRNATPFYNMYVTFLGGLIVKPLPRRNFARYIFLLWVFSSLILRSAYQSGLYEILRDDRNDDLPKNLIEFAKQNYAVLMRPENVWYLDSLPDIRHVRFINKSEFDVFPVLAKSSTEKRIGILTPYEYFGYFRRVNRTLSRRLSLVPERILPYLVFSFVPRNSFLLPMLDEQILRAQNHGFIERWSRLYVEQQQEKEMNNGRATAVVRDIPENMELNILSMNELEGIFLLHMFLLSFAFFVFVVELVVKFLSSKV